MTAHSSITPSINSLANSLANPLPNSLANPIVDGRLAPPAQSPVSHSNQASSVAACIVSAAKLLVAYLETGTRLEAKHLRTAMETAFGASDGDGAWIWKDAYEAAEIAQIMMISRYGKAMLSASESYLQFLSMVEKVSALVPTQTRRSEDMVALQQFSTPLPYAAIAARTAELQSDDVVLEPSAGTGMLAVFAALQAQSLHLNEICDTRRELLTSLFPRASITNLDAASIDDRLDRDVRPSVILMNPPFSAALNVDGRHKAVTANHVLSALARLKPGGRLVAITGSNFNPSTKDFGTAFERIARMANVVVSVPVSGKLYASHGTNVETRVTIIDKTVIDKYEDAPPSRPLNSDAFYPVVETLEELSDLLFRQTPPRPVIESPVIESGATEAVEPLAQELGKDPSRPIHSPARSSALSLRDAARAKIRVVAAKAAEHPFDSADIVELDYAPVANIKSDTSSADTSPADSVYEPYRLQAITIAGAAEHPTKLVQSAAMASVAPPLPQHRPKLLKSVIEDKLLSGPQLESIIYAGDAHGCHLKAWFKPSDIDGDLIAANCDDEDAFQLRKGWFLGDGTGCGKGRQVAGIIMDNWLHGRRRAVWVSKSDKLLEDAKRDWIAIGGHASDIVSLARFKQGSDIRLKQGILFVTYATLRSASRQVGDEVKASRLDQVVDWLGKDFDGVIAFDEGHAMANAAAQKTERGDGKASQQGLAGLALQNRVPDARVVYVSATGATEVSNLAYASRLGLWTSGDFPFNTRAEFVSAMEAGGIAAMEIISRDLKELGLYLARSLSYDGVEYEMLVHELTAPQIEIYDSYAEAFQVIHNNLDQALEATGITSEGGALNSNARSAARSAFESNKQRFFNHLITAMKCPSIIQSIEADIEAGHCAVVQVVSTSEALMDRRLEEIPASDWHDLHIDITPREHVMDYLNHSFPTVLFEPYTDEDGNLKSRPARDASGNPVICREAERTRDALIERLGMLAPVQSALDQIIWHFGTDQVAEVTGRKRRIVKTPEGRLAVNKRPGSSNLAETQSFMDDDKRILIFSDAGGTGRSYHADIGVKNQRLRVHYLLEPGWKADNAIQGLGRTNRTNQAQPPLFRPTATNVKGEKRFLSTIARRLDTFGAITKGQRETGGQNMFRAEDNLESVYARKALRQFFYKLRAGQIDTCSYDHFQQITGLSLDDDGDGCLKENLPPIQQFLNRCLALAIEMQDTIFEAFTGFLDAIIDDARKAGVLDMGLETLRGEKFEIIDRRVIYEDDRTGSQTSALTIKRTDRNHPLSLGKAQDYVRKSKSASLYWNKRSKRAAIVVKAPAFMDETGVPILRVELIRPMDTEFFEMNDFIKSHWEECSQERFDLLWCEEVEAVPEYSTSHITMISGLLLPIWDRLPADNMRIYRLETSNNERVLGRLVTQSDLINVYNRLGLDCQLDLSAEDVCKAVMDQRTALTLVSGSSLRRALVMGKPRLELVDFKPSAVDGLKQMGCFTEIIQWKTRLFVPLNDLTALSKLLDADPVGRSAMKEAA